MVKGDFYIVDVFAEAKYTGNQLAVFSQGHLYSDEEMLKLTREMNYSETTFIFPHASKGNVFKVRIFTPEGEIPFAGHPTLGTAYIIRRELLGGQPGQIVLDLAVGLIPVNFQYGPRGVVERLTMEQVQPAFGRLVDKGSMARVLGIEVSELDPNFPVEEVSTGLPFIIVPMSGLAAVKKVQVNVEELLKLTADLKAKAIFVFSRETYEAEHHLNARMFGHFYGVFEDPATGSANGCLAAYLLKHQYLGDGPLEVQVEQGYEIGRKSLLYLTGCLEQNKYRLCVGGKVQLVAKGELLAKHGP